MEERLQKIMARSGLGSRRACEIMITARRVTVNCTVAILGQKADPLVDRIVVDGKQIKVGQELVYIALHKPRGVVTTTDEETGRSTVLDMIPVETRLYPVGRLDMDSEGLILLTNDGELTNRLTHPRYGHEKEYRVLASRHPDENQLEAWRHGVVLDDGSRTAPAKVWLEERAGQGSWLRVVMREGRKRQIRETGKQIGLPISRIIRLRIGSLHLGNLKPGEWRYLKPEEVHELEATQGSVKDKISHKTLKQRDQS